MGDIETKYVDHIYVAFVALCQYNMYYIDANRPEKKDQALTYVYWMVKLSMKHIDI